MAKFYKSELVWLILLLLTYLGFSYGPIVYNYQRVPIDRYYLGSEDYPLDMVGNLAHVREGYNGHWLRFSKFTSTISSPGTWLKFEYILIGQAARVTHVDPFLMFHITKIIVSLAYICVIIWFVRIVYQARLLRVLTYGLTFFATSVAWAWEPLWENVTSQILYDSLVFVRLTQAAHHYLLGGLFTLVSLIGLGKTIDGVGRRTIFWFLVACIGGFLTSWVYAPNTVLVVSGLPIFLLILWAKKGFDKGIFLRVGRILIVYVLIVVSPMLYVRLAISHLWDWSAYGVTEKLAPFNFSIQEYLQTMGWVYILAWGGALASIRTGSTLLLLIAPTVATHFLGVFVTAPLLQINQIRYFLSLYFVLNATLAVYGLKSISSALGKFLSNKWRIVALAGFVFGVIFFSGRAYEQSWRRQFVCFCLYPQYGYPPQDLMIVIDWLENHTKEEDVVLSSYFSGTLIPAFAGNQVVTSWWYRLTNEKNLWPLMSEIERFYKQEMKEADAANFIKQYDVKYVLLSDEERNLTGENELRYKFLTQEKAINRTVLYKVVLDWLE